MQTSLSSYIREGILGRLHEVNTELSVRYPGDGPRRQPVHTVYGGAHLFRADTARKLGDLALRSLEEYAPDAQSLVDAVGFTEDRRLAETVYARIVDKLRREPIDTRAAGRGAARLTVDASDSAQDFFRRRGYALVQRNTVSCGGEWLANTTMRKALAARAANEER